MFFWNNLKCFINNKPSGRVLGRFTVVKVCGLDSSLDLIINPIKKKITKLMTKHLASTFKPETFDYFPTKHHVRTLCFSIFHKLRGNSKLTIGQAEK